MSQLVGLYGPSGCGKTRFVEALVNRLALQGYSCRGVCSPAVFADDLKIGIQAKLIPSGEQRPLAKLAKGGEPNLFGKWQMFPEALAWALAYLQEEQACDVYVIDELGPYEVEQGLGWAALLPRLELLPATVTLITFRPSLQAYFSSRYPQANMFNLEEENQRSKAALQIEELLSQTNR